MKICEKKTQKKDGIVVNFEIENCREKIKNDFKNLDSEKDVFCEICGENCSCTKKCFENCGCENFISVPKKPKDKLVLDDKNFFYLILENDKKDQLSDDCTSVENEAKIDDENQREGREIDENYDRNYFNFQESNQKNLLKNAYDITYEFTQNNELVRAVTGNLLQINSQQKFTIILNGFGRLPSLNSSSKCIYNFISSNFILPYDSNCDRKILCNFVFEEGENFPENPVANLEKISEISGQIFFVPILKCKVKNQSVKNDQWTLVLEEI